MVHPQPLQAAFQPPQEFDSRAIRNFGCEPHFLAARGHHLADARLALAISVCIRRVQISNAKINRSTQRGQRLIFVVVHEEAAAASECQNRDFGASSPQSPRRKRIHHGRLGGGHVLQQRQTRASRGPQTNSLKKFSARELFAHGLLLLDELKPHWHSVSYEFNSTRRSSRQAGSQRGMATSKSSSPADPDARRASAPLGPSPAANWRQ